MTSYQVKVTMKDVFDYSMEEGQGKHIHSINGFEIGNYPTLMDAKKSIKSYFGYLPDPDGIFDNYIRMTRIEDEDGNADVDGNYIVDYTVYIYKVEPVAWLIGPMMWYQKNDPRF